MARARNIVVGVTGSVAIFKACDLVSRLRRSGACVMVVMTESATRLARPDLFRSLSGHDVATALFDSRLPAHPHIELGRWADLVIVAPATANLIAKAAAGIADDLLSTLLVATRAPVLFAPAMNSHMWDHPATEANVAKLRERGCRFVEGEPGWLACGDEGRGRMAEVPAILEAVDAVLGAPGDLAGVRVLITAGRTEEPIDDVRYLSNRSSGKTGAALAEEAVRRGARVVYVTGPASVPPPESVDLVEVRSAEEMKRAVLERLAGADVLVMAAAVADYRPAEARAGKIRRGREPISLPLVPTEDILEHVKGARRADQVIVGFALETEGEVEAGKVKLREKGLDLLVVNNPIDARSGFGQDEVRAAILAPGSDGTLSLLAKKELARAVFDRIVEVRRRG
jgi:phosphopantothenoylcysteine decarboxylase/phosphopantothenate--cysteine ligase